MNPSLRRALFLVASFLVVLPGCAFLQNAFKNVFEKPSFKFKTANLADASLSGMTVDLVYTLDNPNDFGLSLADVDYKLFVEDKQVVAGQPKDGLTLKAKGESDLTFPAGIKFKDLSPVLQTFLNQDTAKYRAEGSIGVKTPVGVIRFPLSKSGVFEIPKVPQLAIESPRISSLTFTGAKMDLPIVLKNRNSFPLPLANLTGNVLVGGARVGALSSENLGILAPGESRTVNLPVTIQFASALSAANAIRSGKGNVALQGQLHSGGEALPIEVSDIVDFLKK